MANVTIPETKYAKSGDIHIAYQVFGAGPLDLVFVGSWVHQIEHLWELPVAARFLSRLSAFSRVITFDKRGSGLSDRVAGMPSVEERMDDLRAVVDAVGSDFAALFGTSEGGALCAVFAATYPERTHSLIMCGSGPRFARSEDFPWGFSDAQRALIEQYIETLWGSGEGIWIVEPDFVGDEAFKRWFAGFERLSNSPGSALQAWRWDMELDIRDILPVIHVPTLVIHRERDPLVAAEIGRYTARAIPGAKFVELPGSGHFPFLGAVDQVVDEVQAFLTGTRPARPADRVLATVLFTDIVESTAQASRMGDRRWLDLIEDHLRFVRSELERFDGREVKWTGDGMLATFDGPTRAIRCAVEILSSAEQMGLSLRAGLHTGECEVTHQDVLGLAVHIASRIMQLARPGEVLVSSTVRDLVFGTDISFSDRGTRQLKGLPGE